MLELTDISKSFQGETAVDRVNLSVDPGTTAVLIGPSGCGKSTILRMIVGLLSPDEGGIDFDGTPVSSESLDSIRLRMGYVIQEGGLFPHFDLFDNAALMARHLGWKQDRIRERVVELARLTRLPEDLLGRYPAQISGGQRQRVSLMRALMLDPELLLLDEPLGALDPLIRADLQDDLKLIFRKLGKTVVLVTHDMGEAVFFGDVIVLLREGSVVQKGSVRELIDRPVDPFVTRFINAQRNPLNEL